MGEVPAAAGVGGHGFSTRPDVTKVKSGAQDVTTAAGAGGRGFSAPQDPLSGRTCVGAGYMGEVAGGASAHPGSCPAESWLFTLQ